MNKKTQFYLILAVIVLTIILLLIPEVRSNLEAWVQRYGFFGMFVASFLGGISLAVPLPYPVLAVPLISAGVSPLLIILSASTGATLGDAVSYWLGRSGGEAYSANKKIKQFQAWVLGLHDRHPKRAKVILLLWASFVPLPNELFVIPFGISKFGLWRTLSITIVGNTVFMMVITYGAIKFF